MKNRIIKIDTGNANKGYVAIDQQYEGFWIVVGHEETEETVWIGEDEAARLAAAIRVTGSTRVDCGACIGTGFAGPDQNCAVCDGRGCFTREEMAERQRHVQRWYEQDQAIRELRDALVKLVGADSREELVAMEAAMQIMPAPDEDKSAAINAIHVLLATGAK